MLNSYRVMLNSFHHLPLTSHLPPSPITFIIDKEEEEEEENTNSIIKYLTISMTQPMDDEVRVSQEQILMIEEAKRLYARLGELLTKMCSLNFSTSREPAHSWSLWDTYRQSLGLAATANFVNLYGLDGTIEELKNAITVHEQAQTLFENRDYDTLIGMAHDPAELRMRILVDPRQELSLEELWKLLHWVQVMQSSRINYPHSSEWANMNLVQIDTLRSLPTSVQTAFLFQLGSLVGNASLAAQER